MPVSAPKKSIFILLSLFALTNCSSQPPMRPYSQDFKPDWSKARWSLDRLRFTSVFGESRKNHFHCGVDLSSYKGLVRPVLPGRILYSWEKKKNPFQKYPGMGNWLALWHGQHFVTTYLHLADNLPAQQGQVDQNHILAKAGNTGRSSGAHLHLAVIDMAQKIYWNPLRILPAVNDQVGPQIYRIIVNTPHGFSTIESGDTILMTRPFPISIRVIDRFSKSEMHRRLGVYELKAIVNGKQTQSYKFDEIKVNSQGVFMQGKTFHDIFANGKDYIITKAQLPLGKNKVEIHAKDFNGNENRKTFIFNVKHTR